MNMSTAMRVLPLLFGLSLSASLASAADPAKQNEVPGRKVDEPLPETYEPLMGSPRNDEDFSQELKQLRQIKEQQREEAEKKKETPVTGQKPVTKEFKIQEPLPEPAATVPTNAPPVEEQGEELRIRDR